MLGNQQTNDWVDSTQTIIFMKSGIARQIEWLHIQRSTIGFDYELLTILMTFTANVMRTGCQLKEPWLRSQMHGVAATMALVDNMLQLVVGVFLINGIDIMSEKITLSYF